MDWTQILGAFGFPIVACIGLAIYVKYIIDAYRRDIKEMREEHKEETVKLSDALNRNTIVIQKLCDRLDMQEVKDEIQQ